MRKTKNIQIDYLKDVYAFSAMANTCLTEVEIRSGNNCNDGKSIMGLFAIDPSRTFTVEYDSSETAFEDFINQFEVFSI